ncbi:PIN domain-containing protein [Candidatus Peregrinibacteria bacterium]|nr:PIN domain-containing protein [Candidatus Peregrinibacteria bacterium]
MSRVLVDTGPLVAILSQRDAHHTACVEQLRKLSPPLLTCWPVITEAAWLLRTDLAAVQRLLDGFEVGLFQLLPLDASAMSWLSTFFTQYADQGVQLADACLVYLAEREKIDIVFTLDRRDFTVYRLANKKALKLLP